MTYNTCYLANCCIELSECMICDLQTNIKKFILIGMATIYLHRTSVCKIINIQILFLIFYFTCPWIHGIYIAQCKREGFLQRIKDEEGEGCSIYGFLEVNKVGGNFHFAPGKSFQQSNMHVHDVLAFHKDSFNVRSRWPEMILFISKG